MGYTSDVVIALDKKVLVMDLLGEPLPSLLKTTTPCRTTGRAVYWQFDSIKWYATNPEIAAVLDFFASLKELAIALDSKRSDPCLYGAMRIGEHDDDAEEWGAPYDFEIYYQRTITYPD